MRALGFLLLIAAVLLGAGLLFGWFEITTDGGPDGDDAVGLRVDRDEMTQDTRGIAERTGEVLREAGDRIEAIGQEAATGTVLAVEADTLSLELEGESDDGPATFAVADDVEIEDPSGQALELGAIERGTRVTVHFDDEGERRLVRRIVVRGG